MRQLQNDLEKIRSFYQNHRSNIPPDSAFTYGLINNVPGSWSRSLVGLLVAQQFVQHAKMLIGRDRLRPEVPTECKRSAGEPHYLAGKLIGAVAGPR